MPPRRAETASPVADSHRDNYQIVAGSPRRWFRPHAAFPESSAANRWRRHPVPPLRPPSPTSPLPHPHSEEIRKNRRRTAPCPAPYPGGYTPTTES